MEYILKEFNKEKISEICENFSNILDKKGFNELSKALQYILRELIFNAFKANLKRIYVMENNDIDETELVSSFSKALNQSSDLLLSKLNDNDLKVKIELIEMSNGALARVHNNSEMLLEEKDYVDKILYMPEVDTVSTLISDNGREGAGLGLRSITRILNESKVGSDSISYTSNNGRTIFEFKVIQNENTAVM